MDNSKPKSSEVGEQGKERIWLVAATIHELKTFLTAIIASAGLLADELQVDKKSILGRLIQGIVRNAHSIDERLFFLSEADRMQVGDFQSQLETVKIGTIIRDIAAQFHPITQSKKQSLTLELPDLLPPVKVNRRYLEQILLTLISNASKFTPEQGQVRVSAWQDGDSLIVQVDDNGVGIPVEEQEKIFQSHYQIRVKGHTGSGLGLAAAKLLVELHGGKIWLKSMVGQGSSFFFSLPLQPSVVNGRRQ